ncbi:MAG: hypothetical protein FVQ77_17145 [Cytophagales bacterium]|nr:hypothetical protein [Cytophagales bacterium]
MAKPQAPLLSLGASGTIAKTLTYARWKGRAYVKHHVAGKDPRTPAQARARDTFKTGDALWVPAPALFKAPWDRFAAGQVKSGYNAWLGRFVRDNIGRTDLLNTTFSPGAAGGLAASAIALTAGVSSITVDFTNPAPPLGWTLESAIAAAIRDGDPATTTFLEVTAGEDAVAQAQVVLSGLTGGALYVVGAWLRWRKPDGSVAYGPSLTGTATPAAGFTVNAVHFDGTNDVLKRAAGLTGAVDGPPFLWSIWINIAGSPGAVMWFFRDTLGRLLSLRNASDKLQLQLRDPAGILLWAWNSDDSFTNLTNPGWHHLLVAANLIAVTPVGQVFLDDAALAITEVGAPTTGDIDWTFTDIAVGAKLNDTQFFNGDVAELYLTDEYLDISVLANRRKFIDASGKPVDLGADGSAPTGTAPLVFFSGATDDWHTNKGSGGGFTEIGALTDAASSPSD